MLELKTKDGNFVDSEGYILQLRGVNLSGSTKLPFKPDGTTHFDQSLSFFDHRKVSFIGRPLEEKEASEHYDRLKKWGFNFLRFLVTWEAVEHAGPGKYDLAYLDYIERMVALAEKKGFYVFMDPHQDVWSRFTGGDGAPGWTLEDVGMEIDHIKDSETAIVHHFQGRDYRRMSWPLNYQKYACGTMFTLFFGGKTFAPKLNIHGKNVETFLQEHYIEAMCRVAKKVAKYKNVIGFDSLNEPSPGWIGKKNIGEFSGLGFGRVISTSPFQEMFLSEGRSVNANISYMLGFAGINFGKTRLNPKGIPLWKKGKSCIWREHGVWDYDPNGAPMLLRPDYFRNYRGRPVEFYPEYMLPFIKKFKTKIQSVQKKFSIFIETDPGSLEMEWREKPKPGEGAVINATHWYDVSLLLLKRYLPWFGVHIFKQVPIFGRKNVAKAYEDTIRMIKDISIKKMGNCPTIIGETGVPMDMNGRLAYRTKNYGHLESALNRIISFIEKHFVHYTLWNYTPDHTHSLGDRWNEEDLSLYSLDTPKSIDEDGGRAVRAFSRPYPIRTKGIPEAISFDMEKSMFKYSFQKEGDEIPIVEIFLPEIHYSQGFEVLVNAGKWKYDSKKRVLTFKGEKSVSYYGITIFAVKK